MEQKKASFILAVPEGAIVGMGEITVEEQVSSGRRSVKIGDIEIRIVFSLSQVEACLTPHRGDLGESYDQAMDIARQVPWTFSSFHPSAVRITGFAAKTLAHVLFMEILMDRNRGEVKSGDKITFYGARGEQRGEGEVSDNVFSIDRKKGKPPTN